MPGRKYNAGDYRFGFNGQEKDDEIAGVTAANYTSQYWEYDSRIIRRWEIDPEYKKAPGWSPYCAFLDNPVLNSDKGGNWPKPIHNRMIKKALIPLLNSEQIKRHQIKYVMIGSQQADDFLKGNQSADRSYIHYMQAPGQTKEEAVELANVWINTNINTFADTKKSEEERYIALGKAMHTMMDATSPSHTIKNSKGEYVPIENDLPGVDSKTLVSLFSSGPLKMGEVLNENIAKIGIHMALEDDKAAERKMQESINNILNVFKKANSILEKKKNENIVP